MSDDYPYLLPEADAESQGWWEALKEHRLVIQECQDCQWVQHPPQQTCRNCLGENFGWKELPGTGTLYSVIEVTQGILGPWRGHDPYNVVLVLADGVDPASVSIHNNFAYNVFYSNAPADAAADLKVGMKMEPVFDDVTAEDTLLRFKPA